MCDGFNGILINKKKSTSPVCQPAPVSPTIRRRRITTFNASFQGFISVWRKIHISVSRVTLPYQLMFEIIPWKNKLDNIYIFLYYNIANTGISDRYRSSYMCIDYKFTLLNASDHCSQDGRI